MLDRKRPPMQMEMFSAAQDHRRHLYHYQSIDGDERLGWLAQTLEHRTIRMSQPSRFNDPWDCKPWFDLSLLDDPDEREQHLQWLARTVTLSPEGIEEMRADRRQLSAAIEFIHVGHVQAIIDMYRVYCLSPTPDQPLMWAHYGDSHKGIALEFDARHEQMQWAYRVHYRKTYPPYRLYEDADNANLVPIYTKSDVWEYEDEYRLVAEERQSPRPQILESHGSMLRLRHGALVGVVLGCLCDEARVREVLDRYGSDLRVRRLKRLTNSYALVMENVR